MISLFENCSFLFRIRGLTSTHRRGGTSTSSNFSNSGTSSGPSSCPSMAGKAKTSIYSPKKNLQTNALKHARTGRLFSCWCLYSPFSGDIMLISGTSFSPRFAGKVRIYACKPAYRPRLVFIFVNNGTGIVQWFLLVTPNLTTIPAYIGRFFLLLLLLHWFFFFSGDGGTITSNPSICKACRSIRKNNTQPRKLWYVWVSLKGLGYHHPCCNGNHSRQILWQEVGNERDQNVHKTRSGQQDQLPMLAQLASIAKHPSSQEIGDNLIPYHDCIPDIS